MIKLRKSVTTKLDSLINSMIEQVKKSETSGVNGTEPMALLLNGFKENYNTPGFINLAYICLSDSYLFIEFVDVLTTALYNFSASGDVTMLVPVLGSEEKAFAFRKDFLSKYDTVAWNELRLQCGIYS